jgi:hypothetical protein
MHGSSNFINAWEQNVRNEGRKLHIGMFHNVLSPLDAVTVIKSKRMNWVERSLLVNNPHGNRSLGRILA